MALVPRTKCDLTEGVHDLVTGLRSTADKGFVLSRRRCTKARKFRGRCVSQGTVVVALSAVGRVDRIGRWANSAVARDGWVSGMSPKSGG